MKREWLLTGIERYQGTLVDVAAISHSIIGSNRLYDIQAGVGGGGVHYLYVPDFRVASGGERASWCREGIGWQQKRERSREGGGKGSEKQHLSSRMEGSGGGGRLEMLLLLSIGTK